MRLVVLLLVLGLFAFPAHATQSTFAYALPTSSPYPGLTMLGNINSAFATFDSNFSGASAPSGAVSYQFWADTTNSLLKFTPDGTTWLPIGGFSGSQWMPYANGVPATIPASTGSANAYVVTYSPAVTAYKTGTHYPFIANFQDTGAATENVNGLGTKPLKKQGGTALAPADITNGLVVETVYDGTNMQIISQLATTGAGAGVSSITCGTGLSGGTITSTGTCALASISNNTFLGNASGSSGAPAQTTISAFLDSAIGSTSGTMMERNGSSWVGISMTTLTSLLNTFTSLLQGLVPASGGGTTNFLRADGSWAAPTASLMTPLGVGSIILGCQNSGSTIAAGSTTAAANLSSAEVSPSGLGTTGDTLAGTWKALATVTTGGANCIGAGSQAVLWQRIS